MNLVHVLDFMDISFYSLSMFLSAGPRTPEYGGGDGGGGIECGRHDVSGVSRAGGKYERGISSYYYQIRMIIYYSDSIEIT